MGIYLNPGNSAFKEALEREIYVDKSLFIDKVWTNVKKLNKYICFSRPRRFGKSTDANMLVAFFSKSCDSKTLFEDLKVAKCEHFESVLLQQMNNHNVIHLDMQKFLSKTHDIDKLIEKIYTSLFRELKREYDFLLDEGDLASLLEMCFADTKETFIFIVDEWDCVFREFKNDKEAQRKYLDYLRLIFKEQPYVEMVYMTGILPIKKYGTHSALNMFDEISMLDSDVYSEFVGFTSKEVEALCEKYDVDYEIVKDWYNGYQMHDGTCNYSPRSVTASIAKKNFTNYWSQTETFEALREYIDLYFEGLKDDVIDLINGKSIHVDTLSFQNDMSSFASKDDIYTLLVHLGYLGYLSEEQKVYIPNNEVRDTFVVSVKNSNWDVVSKVFKDSRDLLEATMNGEADRVAHFIENSHYETSILQYNDENALAYTVSLAYIVARQKYMIVRELPTGKGFADIVFIPKKGVNAPAMIIELKFDNDADTGINQIKEKRYFCGLNDYLDNLLMVGISYDKNKKHQCVIEKYEGR